MALKTQTVDWKEEPTEVMDRIDRLAGAKWRRSPSRWDFTDALDLDQYGAATFLPVVAGALATAGLALVQVQTDSDQYEFGVVALEKLDATLKTDKKLSRFKPEAPKVSAKARANPARAAVAEMQTNLDAYRADGLPGRADMVELAARAVLAAGDISETQRLLALQVDVELEGLDADDFRTHGPHIHGETLGAAILTGRGGELVRAWAHVYSLGERPATQIWRTFIGRDVPANVKLPKIRRDVIEAYDKLFTAPKTKLASEVETFITKKWSTWSRGHKGSRASFLATGMLARAGVKPPAADVYKRYIAPLHATAEVAPNAKVSIPPPPPLPKPGTPRDHTGSPTEHLARASALDAWVRESLQHAKSEKSGMYLRAIPEAAVDVATLMYAIGAPLDSVRSWLKWAVDTDIARCEGKFAEDSLAFGPRTQIVAGAAVIVGRERELAKAWSARTGDAAFQAVLGWLTGATKVIEPKARTPREIVRAVNGGSLADLVREGTPHRERSRLSPFDAFVTAVGMRTNTTAPQVMHELTNLPAPERETFSWSKPRLKIAGLSATTETLWQKVQTGGTGVKLVHNAEDLLKIARYVHALGAPLPEVAKWIRRSVDLAASHPNSEMELLGAALLLGRGKELAQRMESMSGVKLTEKEQKFYAPEAELTEIMRAYATRKPIPAPTDLLRQRTGFPASAKAMIAVRDGDSDAFRKTVASMNLGSSNRILFEPNKVPPRWSFFVMGLTADLGDAEVLPPSALPFVDVELIRGAIANRL